MILTFDFHNHSCLSPCASLENSPSAMAARAAQQHLDLFALTDHNSALNAPAFAIACGLAYKQARRRVCARAGPIPLFGLEINPFEEAHLLAVFPDPLSALAFSDWVFRYLPPTEVDPGQFGDQVVVDPEERILAMPRVWYGNALQESFTFFAKEAAGAGALVIPAHIDRPQFSVYSQLGFLPEGAYDAVEAMWADPDARLCGRHCVISGSDAHVPEHIGLRPSTVEICSGKLVGDLRSGLAAMLRAWEELQPEIEARAALQPDAEAMCGAALSSEIPGLAPLVGFLEEWYPRGAAQALFEEIRRSFHAGRAWSVYKGRHPANSAAN
jgi:hypothetical protein